MFIRLRRVFNLLFGPRLPIGLGLSNLQDTPSTRIRAAAQQLRMWKLARLPDDPPFADPTEDPWSRVRQPRRFGPGGRSAAVALDEPDDGDAVVAIAEYATTKR
jgi:hypothetical protein